MSATQDGAAHFVQRLTDLLGEEAAWRCWRHWQLVQRWQAHTNLTGVRSDEQALHTLYLDALAALPMWPGGPLLDVGSGAGFPGLVLAMARPQRPVTLVEPRRKRASFLHHAAAQLGLGQVRVLACAIDAVPDDAFEVVTMRAVFAGDAPLASLARLLHGGGRLLVFRQGAPGPCARAGGLFRVGMHPTPGAPSRRIDEWRLAGALA